MAHIKGRNSGLWMPQTTHEKIDSQKMFIENMEQHEKNYTDLIERVHAQVNSIAELKALDVQADTIKEGTIVLVSGYGLFYYTLVSEEEADDKEIIAPSTGSGLWILSGGGGSLVVGDEDYGTDTDEDQSGIAITIKKLFNKKLKKFFYPVTTTKAVRDTASGKSLFDLLTNIAFTDDGEESSPSVYRDADMLGGIEAKAFALKEDYNGIICILLEDGWVYDKLSKTFLYTIPIPSLNGTELFDVNLYDDGTASQEQIDTFNELVSRIDVNAGEVIIQAIDKPDITFSIILRGMCNIEDVVVANLSDVIEKYDALFGELKDMHSSIENTINSIIKAELSNYGLSTSFSWDGDITNLDNFAVEDVLFYKVSDNVFDELFDMNNNKKEVLSKYQVGYHYYDGAKDRSSKFSLWEDDNIVKTSITDYMVIFKNESLDGISVLMVKESYHGRKKGTYFSYNSPDMYVDYFGNTPQPCVSWNDIKDKPSNILVDETIGKTYKLYVSDGKLKMKEVNE